MATAYSWKLTSEGVLGHDLPEYNGKPRGCHHLHRTVNAADDCRVADRWLNRGYGLVATDDRGKTFRELTTLERG